MAAGTVAGMVLENIAAERQRTPKQVALAWLLIAFPRHAAYSRNVIDPTPRGKRRGRRPAIE
jgi:hypothetical protein